MKENIANASLVKATEKSSGDELQELIAKANEVGILNISAHGGMTKAILEDAIRSAKHMNKYFAEHPDK